MTPSDERPAPPTAWAGQRERGNLRLLRLLRWIALTAGRPATRLLLRPIALYAVFFGGPARRASRAYLARVLGRPATWRDGYAHVFSFCAVVLDRVYLLQERFDDFRFEASGIETIMGPASRGEGVLAFGAHLGSFEALRMIGLDKGLRVAMIMYEDNARLINATLAAIAPKAKLHTIGLGRVDAMLAIRRWLDDGGLAGLLADRTLPGQSERSKSVAIAFLGAPALFPDGPFRLAAMLRRKVVFIAGLYRGGRDYDLRFMELADFSAGPPLSGAERDVQIRAALERYVATLEALCREAPYNWFNFFDFWADASDSTPLLPGLDRRRFARVCAAAVLAPASCLAAAAAAFDLSALTALLGRVQSGEASFTETRRVEMLDRTLVSSGVLSFHAPDSFVRETLQPRREKLAVAGNTLTLTMGGRSRTMQLDASPEAAVIVEALRGTLTGNRVALERLFEAGVSGSAEHWSLELVPRDLRLRGQVASVRVSGRDAVVREVAVLLADGDRSVMTITPR